MDEQNPFKKLKECYDKSQLIERKMRKAFVEEITKEIMDKVFCDRRIKSTDDLVKVKHHIDEEMNKFTEGFAYKPTKEENQWIPFSDKKPKIGDCIWVDHIYHGIIFVRNYTESNDDYSYGLKYWQYAYPPELPEKKEKITHACQLGNTWCFEENCKLFIIVDKEAQEINFCPICGFTLGEKDEN